jgi:hypothetical protein
MQFIQHGPDIPEALLRAHEEGKVVFFCGAGISYPAGLPGFGGLVNDIYKAAGTSPDTLESRALTRKQYDATLDLLERRLPGQRAEVRRALFEVLKPDLTLADATDTHAALLELARSRDGSTRLVTTNFDRVFQHVIEKSKPHVPSYAAPLLPIPKNSRWNGVVYLHGLLPEHLDQHDLNRLVLTSGDFGLAYLTERWAARFVSELFRHYVVCFVGYSIDDPVMRYMMDALAADRMLGEATPQAYALGEVQAGGEAAATIEWKAKGVVPVLYEVQAGTGDHSAVHKTLKSWAETYRDGIQGKERIVVDYAMARPSASTREDDFVGRMLWALSDSSGLPAKRFAEIDPAPGLEWLHAFNNSRYNHSDLVGFGVTSDADIDKKLAFSLVHRPTPYRLSPWMSLVSSKNSVGRWDAVMNQMARWLTRHLNDPELVLWLAHAGGQLHEMFLHWVEQQLTAWAQLERDGKTAELDRIRANAPNAIPSKLMQIFWRLLLTGRVKSPGMAIGFYHWKGRLKRDGFTPTLRLELRERLAPKVLLKDPISSVSWDGSPPDPSIPLKPKQLVNWELVLTDDDIRTQLSDLQQTETWQTNLPRLIDDFQQLLNDALDLLRELQEADDFVDRGLWDLPSISAHWQNRGYRDWVILIELLRDAWLNIYENDNGRARRIAEGWLARPYATFRRLALFAASHDGIAPSGEWVSWLLENAGHWLWSMQTRRETCRLIVLQGKNLPSTERHRLEDSILSGPPKDMFSKGSDPKQVDDHINRMIWLRLAKLKTGGSQLGEQANAYLVKFSKANPKWIVKEDESDEFPYFVSGTGDPGFTSLRQSEKAPRYRQPLVQWLKKPPSDQPFYEDNWRTTCRERFFVCISALCSLSDEKIWPLSRWREALQAWSDEKLVMRSWKYVGPLLQNMPAEEFGELAHAISWWLSSVSKAINKDATLFVNLCERIVRIQYTSDVDNDGIVTRALNHPIGLVTQALVNFWFQSEPSDNDGLPNDVRSLFTQLCDLSKTTFRYGRVILAANLIALFRVDSVWTHERLLPAFKWESSKHEACAVWEGFLWSPRLNRPLISAFKESFLETAHHYAELGEHGRQYAAFFTYAALDPADTFTIAELHTAITVLPQDGLQESALAMVHALEGAGDQREFYWTNRILPFWKNIWPKSVEITSPSIAEKLARLAIASGNEFPAALAIVRGWLQPLDYLDLVVHSLRETNLCERFSEDALELLSLIVDDQPWPPSELGGCLDAIAKALPTATLDSRYQRLKDYVRRRSN